MPFVRIPPEIEEEEIADDGFDEQIDAIVAGDEG